VLRGLITSPSAHRLVLPDAPVKAARNGIPGSPSTALSTHCRSGNSHFLFLPAQMAGSARTPATGLASPRGPCLRNAGQRGPPRALPRDGCVSPGQKDKQPAQLSPRGSHDVSGSASCAVCRSDMTQPVSAWQRRQAGAKTWFATSWG